MLVQDELSIKLFVILYVKLNNIEIIEKKLGIKIPLEDNEQTLPMSKKRREKYEVGHENQ